MYAIDKIILNFEKELKIEGLLIDYIKYESKYDTISITRGDSKSNSIAAASILAKESRDKYMRDVGEKYPEYGFESNVGYGTKKHLEALRKHGCIKGIHRESFAPIKKIIGEIGYVLDKET